VLIILFKFFIIVICGYLSAIFSGSEVAILSANRIRLLELKEEGNRAAKILLDILERPSQIVSTLLVANVTANVVMVVLWANIIIVLSAYYGFDSWVLVAGGVFLTTVLILFCEILPKNLFHQNPEYHALKRAGFLKFTIVVSTPIVWLAYNLSKLLLRIVGITLSSSAAPISEEEIIDLIETGEEEGVIQEHEREMIHSIFEFGDLRVRDVMIPRVDMNALKHTAKMSDALKMVVETGHSRIPVYGKDRDNIVGLIYAKDLLDRLSNENVNEMPLKDLIREVEFVPEEMALSKLFNDMKRKKNHFAIVADEYGGTAGLVTIEDVLEEIVGEIEDEFDQEEPLAREEKGVWIVEGKLNLHDLEDLVDVEFPENGADTVGGLIYMQLGRIPDEGNQIEMSGLIFKIHKVENQRITEIEIRKAKQIPAVKGSLKEPVE
jgi:CBS domain containing-hemolysin-like protein